MTSAELDRLVARIGDEILARMGLLNTRGTRPGVAVRPAGPDVPPAVTRFDTTVARLIDHTQLRQEAARADIVQLCREARQYQFASVCVNPYWVPLAAAELDGSPVKVCTVAGFPLGANTTEVKVSESQGAVRAGAREIDMVMNVGALRSGDFERVKQDMRAVVEVSHAGGALVKVIIETCCLDDHQKAVACAIAKMAGADFVKTSTGFAKTGATEHDVALMRQVVGPDMGVKAAGGIRSLEDLRKMVAAGATRVGASSSVKIIQATAG